MPEPDPRPLLVVAVGGNALVRAGERPDVDVQRANAGRAAAGLAALARDHRLVVTHGNGPQIGLLELQAETRPDLAPPPPLDALSSEAAGLVGYVLVEALDAARAGGSGGAAAAPPAVTVLTRVVVDPGDPAFATPTKPIGPRYDAPTARRLAAAHRWTVTADDRGTWRRTVPSPEPREVVELGAIRVLAAAGIPVVCTGGGGVPVVRGAGGVLRGVEAVIDKDLTAALLAVALDAAGLVILTDVDAVYDGWGTAAARPIHRTTVAELRARNFAPGSMGPKVEAACRFVEVTGRSAAIGALDEALAVATGRAGTRIT